jgi:hypothetical protein
MWLDNTAAECNLVALQCANKALFVLMGVLMGTKTKRPERRMFG